MERSLKLAHYERADDDDTVMLVGLREGGVIFLSLLGGCHHERGKTVPMRTGGGGGGGGGTEAGHEDTPMTKRKRGHQKANNVRTANNVTVPSLR